MAFGSCAGMLRNIYGRTLCGPIIQVFKKLAIRGVKIKPVYQPKLITPLDPEKVDPEGLYSANVLEFIEARHHENQNGKVAVVTNFSDGEPTGMIYLSNFIFGTNARIDVIHQVCVWQRACARRGTASTKTRAEVRGGGRKPWPQKGTGRARQGSIRAPQWRGGGVVHGPKPRSYAYRLSDKVVRLGMRSALACRFAQGDFYIVDSFDGISPYEEDLLPMLQRNEWENALLVDGLPNSTLKEATSFLQHVHVCSSRGLTVLDIMSRTKLIMSVDAVRRVEDDLCVDNALVPSLPNEGKAGIFNPNEE